MQFVWMGRAGWGRSKGLGSQAIGAALALGVAAACGGSDTTRFTTAEMTGSELEPEPVAEESRTFAILSERESVDALCRFVGVSGVSGSTAADRTACSELVSDCRGNVEAALGTGGAAPAVGVPSTNLEALFGCPLTLPELDRCVAGALERGIVEYGDDVDCEMPALPAIDPITLFASPDCLGVLLQCPELVASIAAPR